MKIALTVPEIAARDFALAVGLASNRPGQDRDRAGFGPGSRADLAIDPPLPKTRPGPEADR